MGFTVHWAVAILGSMATFLQMQLPLIMADCPLDLSGSNFTLAAALCSSPTERGKCCRYINAFVAVSVARYSNVTGDLGVNSDSSDACLTSISDTLELHGIPNNATRFCGFGTKIPVTYECKGRTSVTQMIQSPGFNDVTTHCKVSALEESDCRECINASIKYLHQTIGAENNVTLNTCRDATFAALASQVDNSSAAGFASCFFRVPGLSTIVSPNTSSPQTPKTARSPPVASPSALSLDTPVNQSRQHNHLTIIPVIGIAVTVVAFTLLVVLIIVIHRKRKELKDSEGNVKTSSGANSHPPRPVLKIHEGPSSIFRKFTYKETKQATKNFSTVIGQGGFGTVYKAEFSDGLMAAVKRMDKISEQGDGEFCKEIELVARLHHRHLVSLKGFCIERQERFLMYEYLENGSLKDHIHRRAPLSWQIRIQIAVDVANALEYLHFYCDPPLCHRDIKCSNILLDDNFVAKVADFGLAEASKDGSVFFEPVNTDVRGTPGYLDPEYVVTRELTEKSDIYSYGVVLLELITARRAIHDNKNLVEWSKPYMASGARLSELVDPSLGDTFDYDQLQTVVEVVKWCTMPEARARPSIKQVLRLLHESSDPMHHEFLQAVEDEESEGNQGVRSTCSKGKSHRHMPSSSSSTRSYCSRSFLLGNGSPQSSSNFPSL
ncbi:hypothetical protein V2J09_002175 [Rumex salicifolius]